jgi:serine/threonine protein kinase
MNPSTIPPSSTTSPGGPITDEEVSPEIIISVAVAVPVVLVLVVIILILCIITVFRCRQSNKRIKLSSLSTSPSQIDRRSRISEIPLGLFFSIPEAELHSGEKVKEGQFSDIYQGTWTQWDDSEMTVAVKQMKDSLDLSTEDSAITDLRNVVSLNYPYLVKFHGICANGSIRIVTDYIEHGGLGLYLAENASYITCEGMMRFMVQVSGAMEYLEVQKIPHGSLSARNVLVASKDNVKVSDIGMLSVVQQGNKDTRNVMAPIRWLAPECIRNNITPSLKSDVWSFGVTMWEILTYGQYPYSELNSPGEVIYQIMTMQTRLPQTGNCTDELFDVISQCE